MQFDISATPTASGTVIVRPQGDLDIATAPLLRGLLEQSLAGGPRVVVCDLSATTFLDSVSLGVLVAAHRVAEDAGGRFCVSGATAHVRRTLQLAQLAQLLSCYETLEDALVSTAPA